jgi:cytochrome P450
LEKGEQWKALRKRFNPGFAPQHLITLLPQIVDKTKIFLSRLDKFAQSGEIFELDQLATGLTFDIIGSVILDIDFNAQDPDEAVQNPIVKEFKRLLPYYAGEEIYQMFMPTYPFRLFRRKRQARRLDKAIQAVISEKFQDSQRQDQEINKLGMKSVLALSMQNIDVLSPTLLQETSDQIKSFLFAGHDTTSILMQWAIYQLLLHPQALATLRAELDTVLGQDADTPTSILERGESALRKLNYTSAIIKETLRLFPPAGSARLAVEGEGLDLRLDDGRIINADGMVLYLCHYAIQRDEKVYGPDAAEWQPERWVGNVETSMEATNDNLKKDKDLGGIPPSAWRPFERGPRNCIGQELANLEARVILACVARRYRFEKVGMGAVVDGTVVGEPLRNVSCLLISCIDIRIQAELIFRSIEMADNGKTIRLHEDEDPYVIAN